MNLLNIYNDLYIFFQDKNLETLKAILNPLLNKNINFDLFSKDFAILIKEINNLPFEERMFNIKKIFKTLEDKFKQKTCIVYGKVLEDEKKNIEEKISKKYLKTDNVVFEYKEDKNITCGVRFSYNFQIFDATLDNYLNKIKNEVKNEIRK